MGVVESPPERDLGQAQVLILYLGRSIVLGRDLVWAWFFHRGPPSGESGVHPPEMAWVGWVGFWAVLKVVLAGERGN
jgi:hypothetical protein